MCRQNKIMEITENITELTFTILTGVYKEANVEVYRKSICIVMHKRMVLINLWRIK